jgi:Flp pilus assembly protein TadB
MNIRLIHLLILFGVLIIGGPVQSYAAVGIRSSAAAVENEKDSQRARKRAERRERRRQRLKKRMDRLEKKLHRKMEKRKEKAAPGVWDDSRFRLGTILLVAGLGLALAGALLGFGFFGFLAGALALAGIILMIWSLVEYYG